MGAIIGLAITFILLVLGYVVGSKVESSHFQSLAMREQSLSGILVSDLKRVPPSWQVSDPVLVVGEVVIATDYFKVFTAGIRGLFGGHIVGYEKLVERARREAICRMLEKAQQSGANVVWNVRIETATISGKQKKKSGGVEVIAYGTAMKATA